MPQEAAPTLPHLAPDFVPLDMFRNMAEARTVAKSTYLATLVEDGWREGQHGMALTGWVACLAHAYPDSQLFYHVPNEGKRTKANGANLKAQGLRSGVPDYCLPVQAVKPGVYLPCWPALYIELKTEKGRLSPRQREYLGRLRGAGNACMVARNWHEAALAICDYIEGKFDEDKCPIA